MPGDKLAELGQPARHPACLRPAGCSATFVYEVQKVYKSRVLRSTISTIEVMVQQMLPQGEDQEESERRTACRASTST